VPTSTGRDGPDGTKQRIVEAALATLKREGFAGTSARAIAREGDFNQALIFYHFGSVNDLLLAALDASSKERMTRYRDGIGGVSTLPQLVAVATEIFREDLAGGHVTVLAELIAGSSSSPELGPEIVARLDQFMAFAEEAVGSAGKDTPIGSLLPASESAYAIVALYLGLELLTHLDGDTSRAEGLFARAGQLATVLGGLFGSARPVRPEDPSNVTGGVR